MARSRSPALIPVGSLPIQNLAAPAVVGAAAIVTAAGDTLIPAAAAEDQDEDQDDPAAVTTAPTVTKAHMFHLVSVRRLRYTMQPDRSW